MTVYGEAHLNIEEVTLPQRQVDPRPLNNETQQQERSILHSLGWYQSPPGLCPPSQPLPLNYSDCPRCDTQRNLLSGKQERCLVDFYLLVSCRQDLPSSVTSTSPAMDFSDVRQEILSRTLTVASHDLQTSTLGCTLFQLHSLPASQNSEVRGDRLSLSQSAHFALAGDQSDRLDHLVIEKAKEAEETLHCLCSDRSLVCDHSLMQACDGTDLKACSSPWRSVYREVHWFCVDLTNTMSGR